MKENLLFTSAHSANILFDLREGFASVADIKDSSKNNLAISRFGTITVGSDADGSYINIPSGNSNYIQFGGSALNGPGIAVEFSMKYMTNDVSTGTLLYDTRPSNTNGSYSFLSVWNNTYLIRLPPTSTNTVGVNTMTVTNPNRFQLRTNARIEYLSNKTDCYHEGVLISTTTTVLNHINQVYKIGYHSFAETTNTVRLYSFRIYKL